MKSHERSGKEMFFQLSPEMEAKLIEGGKSLADFYPPGCVLICHGKLSKQKVERLQKKWNELWQPMRRTESVESTLA